MGKPNGNQTTTSTSSAPPPQVLQNYTDATNRASQVSSAPYAPYTGNMVAPFSDLQTSAFANASAPGNAFFNAAPGIAGAYGNAGTAYNNANQAYGNANAAYGNAGTAYGAAAQEYGASTTPLYDTVNNYLSPYTQDVVNATAQQFNNQNKIQNAGVVGNAVSQGAWGGDRSAIAQAITAGQQQQAEAPVLAGLYNTGYQTALGANEAQNWLYSQAGAGLSGIGQGFSGIGAGQSGIGAGQSNIGAGYANLGAGLTGYGTAANAAATGQVGTYSTLGAQQQALAQAGLNVPYQQYVAGQAYPFQTSQFFTNAAEGIGGLSGGTSTTSAPGPSPISQVGGLLSGAAGIAGLFLAKGGRIDPAHGQMPVIRDVQARPMAIGIRGIPHKLKLADGGEIPAGIMGYRQGERHFANAGVISPLYPNITIPDESLPFIPLDKSSGMGIGPPKPPTVAAPQPGIGQALGGMDFSKLSGIVDKIKGGGDLGNPTAGAGSAGGNFGDPFVSIDTGSGGNFGGDFEHGGGVGLRHYDDGGDIDPAVGRLPDPSTLTGIATQPTPGPGAGIVGSGYDLSGIESKRDFARVHGEGRPVTRAELSGIAPTLQGIDPSLSHIVQRESGNQPYVGYTSPATFKAQGKFTDLRDAPVDETGAPVWAGDIGPQGPSHAFGPAQIQPGTWKPIAKDLGITDWRAPGAYAAVANELHRREGDKPWAASAPGGTSVSDADSGMPAGVIAPQQTQLASSAGGDYGGGSNDVSITTAPQKQSGFDKLKAQGVNPWLALAIAGFGTAAGRSPFAMQNIGAGGLEAAKYLASGPELALKTAQARKEGAEASKAEFEVNAWKAVQDAYSGNASPTPQVVAGALDTQINDAKKAISAPPATAAAPAAAPVEATPLPAPGNAAAPNAPAANPAASGPVTGALPQPPPEIMQAHQQYQQQVAQIDQQIAAVQRDLQIYQKTGLAIAQPAIANAKMAQLNSLLERRTTYVTQDPYTAWVGKVSGAGAEAQARVGPEGQIAQNAANIDIDKQAKLSPILAQRAGTEAQARVGPAIQQKGEEAGIETAAKGVQEQVSSDQTRIDKELRPAADHANDTMGVATLIHDVLQQGPATGWGAAWKLDAGRVLKGLGASDDQVKAFTGTNVPAGQELEKLFLQQSAAAVRTMGAREPGSVISLFKNAYPNIETDPKAIHVMENVLYMQGKQQQDFYNLARAQHTAAVAGLQQKKPYEPLDALEKDFRTIDGAHGAQSYLKAAQAMSGDPAAWQGTSKEQQRQILSLIPSGHSVNAPDGSRAWVK